MAGRFGSTKSKRTFGNDVETGDRAAILEQELALRRSREKMAGDKSLRIEKEFMLRQNDMDTELCHLTRVTPEPGAMAKRVFNIFDVVRQLINVWILTFALMELDNRWNEGFDLWRIYIGLAAAYVTVETLAIGAGVFMGFYNERFVRAQILLAAKGAEPGSKQFEDATAFVIASLSSEDSADGHITLPSLNTPVPRLGLVYHATLAAGWIITWSYLYMDLNTGDGINMVTFNDARSARVFIYLAALLSGTDFLIAVIDYKGLMHVGLDMETKKKKACKDLHMQEAEGFKENPEMGKLLALLEPLEYITNMTAVVLAYELAKQLTQGPAAFFDINTWRMIAGSTAGVLAGFVVLHWVGLFQTWGHKCNYRVVWDGMMYWLLLMGGFGGTWLYMLKVSSDSTTSLQSRENYLWWMLFLYGVHLFFTIFHHLRCFISVVWQREFWPNLHGI